MGNLFAGFVLVLCLQFSSVFSYESCHICINKDCCDAPIAHNAGACSTPTSDVLITQALGRPLWLSLISNNKSVSFALNPSEKEPSQWEQYFYAHAFFPFNEDILFSNNSGKPSLITRRWGVLDCFPSGDTQTFCTAGGWVNCSLTVQSPKCPTNLPYLTVVWWGEDVGHGAGEVATCLGYLPQQAQPQPPSPTSAGLVGGAWSVLVGSGQDAGTWPATTAVAVCQ